LQYYCFKATLKQTCKNYIQQRDSKLKEVIHTMALKFCLFDRMSFGSASRLLLILF